MARCNTQADDMAMTTNNWKIPGASARVVIEATLERVGETSPLWQSDLLRVLSNDDDAS